MLEEKGLVVSEQKQRQKHKIIIWCNWTYTVNCKTFDTFNKTAKTPSLQENISLFNIIYFKNVSYYKNHTSEWAITFTHVICYI